VICTCCGYLELQEPTAVAGGDPMRRVPMERSRARGRCPGCGERAWADPLLEATALALRGAEDRLVAPQFAFDPGHDARRRAAVVGYAMLMLLPLAWLAWLVQGLANATVWLMLVAAIALGIGTRTVLVLLRHRPLRAPRIAPMRWHLALPTETTMRDRVEGPVRARDPLLEAPLSRRPCIAYELGVRGDGDLVAPAHTWLLLEQRSVAFAIGPRTFPADAVRLELPRMRVELDAFAPARVDEVLRTRALAGERERWVVTETIVPEGAQLAVRSEPVAFGEHVCEMPCARCKPAASESGGA
jgi:hypothetical protein